MIAETALTDKFTHDITSFDIKQAAGSNKYLVFDISEILFGISMAEVAGIVETQEIDEVPVSSDLVCGLMNHHTGKFQQSDIYY